MSDGKAILGVVIAVCVGLLLVGYLLPVGMTAYHTENQIYTNTLSLTGGITAIGQGVSIDLTAVNESVNGTFAVYEIDTLIDTQVINLDATGSFVCPGGTVTVKPTAITADSATITVIIPQDFRWSDGENSIFSILGIFVLIGILIAFIWLATSAL